MKKIRVLVVDDSALMRKYLREILEEESDMEVVAVARNGREAVAKALELDPDVITMDVNMPEMDGLTAIQYIMHFKPCPVVVVSSLTRRGALTTFEALELGAVDYIPKPDGTVSLAIKGVAHEIREKVRASAALKRRLVGLRQRDRFGSRVEQAAVAVTPKQTPAKPALSADYRHVVLIGVSTGGPKTLMEIIPHLPAGLPAPVVVFQHMPDNFTRSFAERLNSCSVLLVKEADDGELLERGKVLVARGGSHLKLELHPVHRKPRVRITRSPRNSLYFPSVDVGFRSALEVIPAGSLVAVLLTGMGDDGADAMVEIARCGGYTIAESEETAIVYGMPREAIERGGAKEVLPSYRIAQRIVELINRGWAGNARTGG
ncbi:protein-glutamate methylesterase/protein-glutamine glutaminase [Desulfofundulus sp.]|uniref:protein-glutamate methylesterase/protein-glutamine glutaminase n=1 Tax=Desulfofundulus sp. TaxID=2282750 RepID=UPI003C733BBF